MRGGELPHPALMLDGESGSILSVPKSCIADEKGIQMIKSTKER